ncbi:hypothetical protein [Nocardia salmonicida]|uniref:hypothetical protein n=1 Tax=Nocardia salmonicida TaxID=53431 RepID=UPI002E27C4CD|nr:hypothetical protein [Nocardia salmonicida]
MAVVLGRFDGHRGADPRHTGRDRGDEQLAALVAVVAQINAANRLGVILHQQGGSYEPGMFDAAAD